MVLLFENSVWNEWKDAISVIGLPCSSIEQKCSDGHWNVSSGSRTFKKVANISGDWLLAIFLSCNKKARRRSWTETRYINFYFWSNCKAKLRLVSFPGIVVRLVQPLLLNHPVESLELNTNVSMCHAVIYEPTGRKKSLNKISGYM